MLGVLAGNDMPLSQLEAWTRSAESIFAADGGVNSLIAIGAAPELVVGDLDSAQRGHGYPTLHDPDQNTSDADKLLAEIVRRGIHAITLCNVEGDQPDHFLGTIHSAARSGLDVRLALRKGIALVLVGDTERAVRAPNHCRISLIPLEPCEGVTMKGVAWQMEDDRLGVWVGSSLSNQAISDVVTVRIESGVALLVMLHPSLEKPTWEQA